MDYFNIEKKHYCGDNKQILFPTEFLSNKIDAQAERNKVKGQPSQTQDRIVLWSSKDIPRKLNVEKAKTQSKFNRERHPLIFIELNLRKRD